MTNIKCVVINEDRFNSIKESLENILKITHLQSYFPILSIYFDFHNNSNKHFKLKNIYSILKIKDKIHLEKDDTYIKHFFNCDIIDNINQLQEKRVFVKVLPILNVIQYMMDEYNTHHNSSVSNIHHYLTNNKINNYHNSAYIDAFFSYLGSKLSEMGKCPTFPLFFETFSGVQEEFLFDITEEYSSLKRTSWFNENILKKKYEIINVDIDSLVSHKKRRSNIRFEKHISIESLNSESLDLDDLGDLDLGDLDLGELNSHEDSHKLDEINSHEDSHTLDEINSHEEDSDWSDISDSNDSHEKSETNEINEINFNKMRGRFNSFDSYESLSDVSISSGEIDKINYCKLKNFPVQVNMIEMLDGTLDNYIDKTGNSICETEWKSILFQICFGLAVSQKEYDFVHNDLHSSNIMFKETPKTYLYFNFKGNYFKIPTYGKITKIIDFGRATFKLKNKIFFSDVFKKNGDAEGQYSFPYHNSIKNCRIKPNKSFDLSRLATTIIEHFKPHTAIFNLLKLWASDKYGNFLMNYEDNFNLYKIIAKNVISAIPKNQINKMIFKEFLIKKEDISPNEFIYNY